jgi:signal peptidase I
VFPNLQVGDVIHFTNFTNVPQDWQVGHGPVGPGYNAASNSTLSAGASGTYTKVLGDEVVSMNFGGLCA